MIDHDAQNSLASCKDLILYSGGAHRYFVVDDRSCSNSLDRLYTARGAGIDEMQA